MAQYDPETHKRHVRAHQDGTEDKRAGKPRNTFYAPGDNPTQASYDYGYRVERTPDKVVPAKHEGLPVSGYKQQSQANVDLVNGFKQDEERILRKLEAMQRANAEAGLDTLYDPRMIAHGRTLIQDAFMWINRAVFQPGRVTLPEDNTDTARDEGFVAGTQAYADGKPRFAGLKENPRPEGLPTFDAWREGYLEGYALQQSNDKTGDN